MGRGKQLCQEEKFTIDRMHEGGKSIHEISRVLNRSRKVIGNYLKNQINYGLKYKGKR